MEKPKVAVATEAILEFEVESRIFLLSMEMLFGSSFQILTNGWKWIYPIGRRLLNTIAGVIIADMLPLGKMEN